MLGIFTTGKGQSESYSRYKICREMGWDYYTYESQPFWFIQEITLCMFHESQEEMRQQKRLQAKNRR